MEPLEGVRVERSADGSQLVYVKHSLETILRRYPQYSNKKVCVLSVAGPFRKGKSFLLNFLLRYLRFQRDGKSGDWFDQHEPLQGFPSKSGATSVTEGILIWPEPFLVEAGDEEVVLLLMDTQGSGDTKSRSSETTAVFALSTLVSSVTKLIFVVRDWTDRTSFGQVDENAFLSAKLSSTKGTAIREAFDELGCWHLPHPGGAVASGRFTGDTTEMKEDFRRHIKAFCEHLLSPVSLVAKTLGEKAVTLAELKDLFESYAEALAKATLADHESVLKAADNVIKVSARAALADLCDKLLTDFDNSLRQVRGIWVDLDSLCSRLMDDALGMVTVAKTIGGARYKAAALSDLRSKIMRSLVNIAVEGYWNMMNEAINSSPEPFGEEVMTPKLERFLWPDMPFSTAKLLKTRSLFMRSLRFELYKAKCHFDAINNRRLKVARGGRILADGALKDVLLCLQRDTLDGVQLVSRAHNRLVRLLGDVCRRVLIGAIIDVKKGLLARTTISVAKLDSTNNKSEFEAFKKGNVRRAVPAAKKVYDDYWESFVANRENENEFFHVTKHVIGLKHREFSDKAISKFYEFADATDSSAHEGLLELERELTASLSKRKVANALNCYNHHMNLTNDSSEPCPTRRLESSHQNAKAAALQEVELDVTDQEQGFHLLLLHQRLQIAKASFMHTDLTAGDLNANAWDLAIAYYLAKMNKICVLYETLYVVPEVFIRENLRLRNDALNTFHDRCALDIQSQEYMEGLVKEIARHQVDFEKINLWNWWYHTYKKVGAVLGIAFASFVRVFRGRPMDSTAPAPYTVHAALTF